MHHKIAHRVDRVATCTIVLPFPLLLAYRLVQQLTILMFQVGVCGAQIVAPPATTPPTAPYVCQVTVYPMEYVRCPLVIAPSIAADATEVPVNNATLPFCYTAMDRPVLLYV